jgi:hypothetical protein
MCATIWDTVFTMYVYTLCFANEVLFFLISEAFFDFYYSSNDRIFQNYVYGNEGFINNKC